MRKPGGRFWKGLLTGLVVTSLLSAVLIWQGVVTLRQARLDRGLLIAVCDGNVPAVTRLLAQGADPNTRAQGDPNMTPRRFLYRLIQNLTHRYGPPERKPTALILAAEHPHPETVRALLQAGAHPDYTDGESRTALIVAAYAGQTGDIQALLEGKATIDAVDDKGRSALMGAAACGYAPSVDVLLAHGANPNVKTVYGRTSLMWAAGFHFPNIVRSLLNKGADVNARDNEGKSALMYALGNGAPKINLPPILNNTLLMKDSGLEWDHTGIPSEPSVHETIASLLKHNADPNTQDNKGISALKQAVSKNYPDLIAMLKQAGTK